MALGGHAKVDKGRILGTVPPLFKKECDRILSKLGLSVGSYTSILVIKFLAASEIGTCSGKL